MRRADRSRATFASGPWIERTRQDIRFAIRLMAKAPGFSAITVFTLALGIGASTAIFSQVNAVFWQPLPVARPHELRSVVWSAYRPAYVGGANVVAGPTVDGTPTFGSVSHPAYRAMRDGNSTFSNLACWMDPGEARPIVMRDAGFGTVHFVSGNYFETLGVAPILGRGFTAADDVPGTSAAILSYAFWRRAFGGRPEALRRTIDLNGKSFAVAGVMPEGFFGLDPSLLPDVFLPTGAIQVAAATNNPRDNLVLWNLCRVFGRLKPGVTAEQARRDLEPWLREAAESAAAALAAMMKRPIPTTYERPRVWVLDGAQGLGTVREAMSAPLRILMTVVIAVLLIACANIAGLLIVRGTAREREIATRLALGASRGRLIRQLLTETVMLAVLGGALGVATALALSRLSPAFISWFMPPMFGANRRLGVPIRPDVRVLMFSVAVTLATGLLFGILPALRATRVSLTASIRQAIGTAPRRSWIAPDKALITLQTALSIVLIIAAGLFVRTIANIRSTPLGYDLGGLLYARIEPRTGGVPQNKRAEFFERAHHRLEQLPGVLSATLTDSPPLGQSAAIFLAGGDAASVCTPGFIPADPQDARARVGSIGPRYFETLRTRLVAGREFTWFDASRDPSAPILAVVNEAFARKFFPARNPLEQRFGLNCPANPSRFQPIGVVADSRNTPRDPAQPTIYLFVADTSNVVTMIVRTAGRPDAHVPAVRQAMMAIDPNVPTFAEVAALDVREQHLQQERLLAGLLLAFGATALLLSSIGIYGMLAYLVARRTSEIGVRMALGADRLNVVAIVLRESVGPVISGIVIGVIAAILGTRWIQSLLYGVSGQDPLTLAAAAALFAAIAVAASMMPALRASRIDPLRALRAE